MILEHGTYSDLRYTHISLGALDDAGQRFIVEGRKTVLSETDLLSENFFQLRLGNPVD